MGHRVSQASGLPKSAFGKACAYALTQWPCLIAYLDHGIDPDAYLRDILQRVPAMKNTDDFGPLTPAHWKPKTPTTSRDIRPAQSAA